MRQVLCWRCDRQIVGELIGNVLILRHRGDTIEIVDPREVHRRCLACGAHNRVFPPDDGPMGLTGGKVTKAGPVLMVASV